MALEFLELAELIDDGADEVSEVLALDAEAAVAGKRVVASLKGAPAHRRHVLGEVPGRFLPRVYD